MMAMVEVSWEELDGTSHGAIRARMEDMSRSGACIRMNTAISVGATVWIKRPWEEIAGVTKYCRRDGMDYVLGIQRILEWRERKSPPRASAAREPSASSVRPIGVSPVARQEMPSVPKGYEGKANRGKAPGTLPVITPGTIPAPRTEPVPNVLRLSVSAETVPAQPKVDRNSQNSQMPMKSSGPAPQDPPPSPDKERRRMSTNWLGMTFRRQKEEAGKASSGAASDNGTADENALTGKAPVNGGANYAARLQGDLQSLEDIYRAAGILNPRMGYSVSKVIEMMRSDHIRGLASDAKRAAILMALDAASISVEEILRDAKQRQDALDAYEAGQRKSFEEYWSRKAAENAQIQAETDRIVAQNLGRIQRNRDEVAHEKAEFARWQATKVKEGERIAEAVGLCSAKAPVAGTAAETPTGTAEATSEVAATSKTL